MRTSVITTIFVAVVTAAVEVAFAGGYDHEVKAKNISFA